MSGPLAYSPVKLSISSPHVTPRFNFSPQGFQGQTGPPGPVGVVGPQVRMNPTGPSSFVPVARDLGGSGSQTDPHPRAFFLSRERQEKQDLWVRGGLQVPLGLLVNKVFQA